MTSIDYLPKDAIIPENQNFCCLSLWMTEDKKTIKFMKVSGAFKNIEDATEQVQILKEPGHYNFVAEMGAWNAFDPLPNNNNLNDELNLMMHRYLINIHRKNLDFEKRKYGMISKNIEENRQIKIDELKTEEEELIKLEENGKNLDDTNKDEHEISKNKKEKYINNLKELITNFTKKLDENLLKEKEFDEKLQNIKIDEVPTLNNSKDIVDNQNKPIPFDGVVKRKDEKIENQNWYCVSFLVEENKTLIGIKINGCFSNFEEADIHSRSLRDINDSVSILVGELYKWQPFNPPPDSQEAGESEYANSELNETIKSKKENEKKAQLYHEFRKNDMIRKNLEETLNSKVTEKDEMSKNISSIKNDEMKKFAEKEILTLEEQIKKLEAKKLEYTDKEKEISEKIGLYELQNKMKGINL